MTHLQYRPDSAHSSDSPRVWIEPVSEHRVLLDGSWWPRSNDLDVELPGLLPALDQIRGPVVRLLLSAAGWATRPHHVVLAGRTVSVGYLADQPPTMMTVLCADGATCVMRVVSSAAVSVSGASDGESDQ
jgi:Family of unknown function (DUF5994)